MEQMAEKTGETINLGIRVGNKIVYVDKLESSSTIKVGLGIGVSVPSYCSGLGKVILAYTSKAELDEILNSISFEKFTGSTITDKNQLLMEFEKIRQNGYSIDDEEYVDGLICFGAPIFDFHGNPVAAISVSCPKYRYDPEKHLIFYTGIAADAARKISKKLGFKSGS
jgi:DNA-binding IclR family transcriptional regulator